MITDWEFTFPVDFTSQDAGRPRDTVFIKILHPAKHLIPFPIIRVHFAMLATSRTDECHSKRQPKRAPRAPNAFMLYRSDFLKRQAVPPEVERRQQNLSRIAGQCWNMLLETEKAIWYDKAAAVRAEYCARYLSHKTGPLHKDTDRPSTEDKRSGRAINPRRPWGRTRSRRAQTPYSGPMFAAIQDPRSAPSSASQTGLISTTPASESPLSATVSPSPFSLSHLLPSFVSHTNPSSQDTPAATSKNSTRNEIGDLPELLGSETPQDVSHIIRDLQNVSILVPLQLTLNGISFQTPSGVGSSQEPYPTLQQYENSFTTYAPYLSLEQIHTDPVSQLPSILSETSTFSPAEYYLASCHSSANNFGATDNVTH